MNDAFSLRNNVLFYYTIFFRNRKRKFQIAIRFSFCYDESEDMLTVDHIRLIPGVYVSRKDSVGDSVVTTFDLRMTSPNDEPVLNTAEVHAIEHLGATFLRNHPVYASKVVYFGPMGCRTGFYLILAGDYESSDIVNLMIEMYEFIRDFEGEIPGACAKDCGNYLDMNLPMAKYAARKYLDEVLYDITEDRLNYPD